MVVCAIYTQIIINLYTIYRICIATTVPYHLLYNMYNIQCQIYVPNIHDTMKQFLANKILKYPLNVKKEEFI
jgi:hypothetical protein